nr:right-handed parallel beta-helix repeat-containing protein [Streptomyces sp. TLI_235]
MGGTINKRTAALAATSLLGALALPTGASAAPTDLWVDNGAGAHCADSGTGTEAAPYCTVQAAADAALPGQTVHVAGNDYPEPVRITRSGTAGAPIRFVGGKDAPSPDGTYAKVGGAFGGSGVPHALVVEGAHHVEFTGFSFDYANEEAVLVKDSSDITLMRGEVWSTRAAGVRVTGDSSRVTVGRFRFSYVSGPLIQLDQGVNDSVVTTNELSPGSSAAVSATGATGTVVVSNTVNTNCHDGIVLAGASTGAVVENNVVDTGSTADYPTKPCQAGASATGITVAAEAAAGTEVDYNVVSPTSGKPAYLWAGTPYTARPAFTTATGQGAHDAVADPTVPWDGSKPQLGPTIDSADVNAPGMLDVDLGGRPAKDDPVVADTGTGFRDRGAWEFANFGSVYTPTGPTRVLDTRKALGAPGAPVASGHSIDLDLAGVAGVPAEGVTAVTLNVTVTAPTTSGFLTVYPHGQERPTASNLNWTTGQTVANLVTVPVVDGRATFFAGGGPGTVEVIADLAGYHSTKGSVFTAAGPTRLLDTRQAVGAPKARVPQSGSIDLQVAGVKGVPATGVTAVTMNVTVTAPNDNGFLTVYPHGQERPTASNLNWTTGQTVANLVTVPVVDGKVTFFAGGGGGSVDVVADLAGYYSAEGYTTYNPTGPWRTMDTRQDRYDGNGTKRPAGPVPAGGSITLDFGESRARIVTLNVTVTQPTANGFLTAYPSGTARPLASNLNWTPGRTVPNQVVVPVGADGKVVLYNGSSGGADMVVDWFGYQTW